MAQTMKAEQEESSCELEIRSLSLSADDCNDRENNTVAVSSSDVSYATTSEDRHNNIDTNPSSSSSSSRRVKKNYLPMVGMAYILTIISPRTSLWSPSLTCTNSLLSAPSTTNITATNQEYRYSMQTISNCILYGTINLSVLAKLTCSTLVLILLFFNLQGSSPGIFTKDVMAYLDDSVESTRTNNTPRSSYCINQRTNNDNCNDNDEERQSFLSEPLPLSSSTKHKPLNNSSPPKSFESSSSHKDELYPHTRRKYCTKCQITPPLRSHHCNHCNTCNATFDHHCLFLDTCIGERNHCRFWCFVGLNVLCCHVALGIVGSSGHDYYVPSSNKLLFRDNGDANSSAEGAETMKYILYIARALPIASKLYIYPIYITATILFIMHTIMAVTNSTTFEMTKGSEHIDYLRGTTMMDFPFGRKGICNNIRRFITRDDAFV